MDLERARVMVWKYAETMTESDLLHQVFVEGYKFTVQHPVHERIGGNLFDCPVHDRIAKSVWAVSKYGWYYIKFDSENNIEWEEV